MYQSMNKHMYTTTKKINAILIDVIIVFMPLNRNSNSGSPTFQTFEMAFVWNCPTSSKDPGSNKQRLCFYLTKIPLSRYLILSSFDLSPLSNWEKTASWWRVRPRQHKDADLCMKWNALDLFYICNVNFALQVSIFLLWIKSDG